MKVSLIFHDVSLIFTVISYYYEVIFMRQVGWIRREKLMVRLKYPHGFQPITKKLKEGQVIERLKVNFFMWLDLESSALFFTSIYC